MNNEKLNMLRNSALRGSEIEYDGHNIEISIPWQDRSDQLDYEQGIILPKSTLSPWFQDSEFLTAYKKLSNHTLVDIYRCYELYALTKQFKNVEGIILEVGTWKGGTAALLSLAEAGEVYTCDTFSGVVKASESDNFYGGGEHSDTSRGLVEKLLSELNVDNCHILEGIFPDESSDQLPDSPIKLCHIDVDTYASAKDVVDFVWPRMISSGILLFDDFGFSKMAGITKLVYELQATLDNATVIHNLNGHALIIKR